MPNILNFTLIALGAFICWTFKGFKGKFSDEMVGPYNWSSKRMRNLIVGFLAIVVILIIFGAV
jgi:hypothetical protein